MLNMDEKKPDSYVFDRSLKAYPTEIGSQPFMPDEIELFKLDKSNKLKHHYVSKFEELKSDYQKLMEDISMNERIYQSSYNFQPIVGQIYYLYKKENDDEFLSIISPIEWNNRYQLIGSYQLQTDGRWNEKKLGT
jgi:hypothetical protein